MSPFKPSRPCPGRGKRRWSCPNLIRGSERYCSDCQVIADRENAKYDQARDQTEERQFIHSTQWRAIRNMKLTRDPLCERCFIKECDVAASMVHHRNGNELDNAEENLESLCNNCHEILEQKGRWGKNDNL